MKPLEVTQDLLVITKNNYTKTSDFIVVSEIYRIPTENL